ncbi:uncharacterized protein LOC111064069 isoform X2 [Nilaparvata lugens]|uniref:uncharacterized protein LOC111064069 isoform X2 n=1 Tax=Nilaparvata lugens TaxID=108931 RepID=UPI00193CEA07|nr:uncharacterized protein LOC111064069 isoform X2 [Nilaparvata lugens]
MNENPTFYRVRNVLSSIRNIREVHYGLGVSVSIIKHHLLTIGNRLKIEEIKYFVVDATTKKLTKTSKLLIKSYKIEKDDAVSIPNFSKEFVFSEVKKKINEEGMAEVEVSSTGESFKIGSSWKKDADYSQLSTEDIYCWKVQYWNPAAFRPEVYKIRNIAVEGTTGQHHKVIAKLSDEEFERKFTIVERSIWNCYHYERGTWKHITDGPDVHLVLHEIIGKIPIKSVSFFPRNLGRQNIYAVKLTGSGETVRYTDMSFYYRSNWTRLEMDIIPYTKTEKSVLFVEIEYQKKNVKETRKEVHYLLDSGNVFSTFINEVGYHLRVGTQTVETIKDENAAECKKVPYDDIFKTDVTILMNKDEIIHSNEAISGDYWMTFFSYSKQEAFLCKSAANSIYRVVNHLSFEKPISEIQTFDGVEIYTKRMIDKKLTVEITEVKYIKSTTGQAVQYVGLLKFYGDYDPYLDISDEMTKRRVLKTKDDIIRLIDMPMTFEKFKDSESGSSVFIGSGPNTLAFSANPNVGVGATTASTVLFCKLTDKNLPGKPLAMFEILGPNQNEIDAMTSETDSEKNIKYFEGLKTEVWICNPKQLEEGEEGQDIFTAVSEGGLIRVVNKQKLKSSAPNDVGIISYQELDKIWVTAGNGDDVTTNAQNVRYYKVKNYGLSQTYFAGYRILDRTPKDIPEVWKSGTQDLTNDFDKPKKKTNQSVSTRLYILQSECTRKLSMKLGI